METETLIASYEHNKKEHIEDGRMDVVPSETLDSPQNEGGESSESIDKFDKDCDQSKLRENEGESEEEQVDQDLGRIEAESDEDCEEEEKLLLSPTHSDKEYDTDEEDDRDRLSADETGGIEDSDEEDDKVPPKDESEQCVNEAQGEASKSPIPEESELASETDQDDTTDKIEETPVINNDESDEKDALVDETVEKAASLEETDDKVASSEETNESFALNDKIEDKVDKKEVTDEKASSNEEVDEQAATIEEADEKNASNDETDKKSASDAESESGEVSGQECTKDHIESVSGKEVDPLENNSGVETEKKGETDDPLAIEDTLDPLESKDDVQEDKEATISMSVDENDKNEEKKNEDNKGVEKDENEEAEKNEESKEIEKDIEEDEGVKKTNEDDEVKETVLSTSKKTEEAEVEEKNHKKVEDTEVDKKTAEVTGAKDKANKENDPTKEGTDTIAEETEGEKNLDFPLLQESLTKPVDDEKSKEMEVDEDIEMDEDFDPSLLCPELSMEVDEAPVITENDSTASENDGNKSPLRLYEPIFSTFVDEITGAEVDFQLTEEELRLREQTYGEKNPIQYTKIHCTACNVHLGSALDGQGNRFVHPLLKVLICKKCYHFYTSGEFEKDEDGSELYCRWCGQGGQVMCCSNCEMVFCKKCIRINFDRKKIAAIRDSDDWLCFRCNPSQLMHLRIHCSEFMEYVQREMGNVPSLENPAAALTTDYCQCCIPHKKRGVEPSTSEPKKKRKKVSVEVDDPDYDPVRDQDTPPPPNIPSSSAPAAVPADTPAATPGKTPIMAAKSATDAAKPASVPQKMGHVPANAAFRTTGPGHQPRPRVQVVTQGQGVRPSSSPGYIKILPGGVRAPVAAPNRPPTPRPALLRPIRPTVPQMKHEWFEKTVRAAARVNSNLSYTLTQLNRAQASATSVEALAVVHNKLQEILSTSINSLIQIRKNLRTEFIAGIKNIRFPPKPQSAQQASTSAAQDDDVIFVSPTTSPVPPPLTSPTTLPAAALNLPSSVTLTKKTAASPGTPKPGPSNVSRPGPSGVSRPGPSNTPRPGPSGVARQGPGSQPKPGPSGVSRTPIRNDQGNAPKSFLRVKSFSALQNVTSECITIPDDPVPEEKPPEIKYDDDDDDDVTVIEKKVEIVTIIDDSPMKSPDRKIVENPDGAKKNLSEENRSSGLTNGSEEKSEEKGKDSDDDSRKAESIDRFDPIEKVKMMKPKILLQRSTKIDELVKSKFGLLNGDASN